MHLLVIWNIFKALRSDSIIAPNLCALSTIRLYGLKQLCRHPTRPKTDAETPDYLDSLRKPLNSMINKINEVFV